MLSLLWLMLACNDKGVSETALDTGEGTPGGGGNGGGAGTPPPPACTPNGFAPSPTDFSLPAVYPSGNFASFGNSSCPEDTSLVWTAFDLDGGGAVDAVGTGLCSGEGEIGKSSWAVHLGAGSGFAETATTFTLPVGYPAGTFDGVLGYDCPSGGALEWSLAQVDGDGQPDILGVSLCDGSAGVGLMQWRVHSNTGAGFEDVGTDWLLPVGYLPTTFDDLGNYACTESADLMWTPLDVDGDGFLDILGFSGCSADTVVGKSEWLLWRGTAAGVTDPPTSLSLPSAYPIASFDSVGLAFCEVGASPLWSLIDINGDEWLDIVVTSVCNDPTLVGITQWTVHAGSSTGFEDVGTAYTLPVDVPPGNFLTMGDFVCDLGGSELMWALFDVTRDGRPDAVASSSCSGGGTIGKSEWRVYPGTSAGFGAATSWWLPNDQPAGVYDGLGNVDCPSANALVWTPADVGGDGVIDVVGTSLCDETGGVGFDHWTVYAGACDVTAPATTPL